MADNRWAVNERVGPWPDVATARSFLRELVGIRPAEGDEYLQSIRQRCEAFGRIDSLATWLIDQGIGPLAYDRHRVAWPELAAHLKSDLFSAVAEGSLFDACLDQIVKAFEEAGISSVLLKGAALADTAYPSRALRTMSDIDLWIEAKDMARAVDIMTRIGFQPCGDNPDRPLALQALAGGEIQFYPEQWESGLIELHWAPLAGWWLERTAAVDDDAIWARKQPLAARGSCVFQLSPEDNVLQVAVHLAVNHHFGATSVRGLIDLVLLAQSRPVDWDAVVRRAEKWRVSVVTWLVLDLADRLIGLPGDANARAKLRPSWFRRLLLKRVVSLQAVLAGRNYSQRARYFRQIFLVDRFRDAMLLIFRTVWPESEWLMARYQSPVSRGRHLWQLLKFGKV